MFARMVEYVCQDGRICSPGWLNMFARMVEYVCQDGRICLLGW